jgi:ABC-2 type transport system permease protein
MINKLRDIYAYREMISNLVKKDLRGRYKGSVLGFLWTFINPLFQIIIYTFVFSIVMKSGIDKFYLYLIVGLIPWIFFHASINGGAVSIISQQDMVKKIYFPREVLPIAYVTSSFINMLFSFIIVFLVLLISGLGVSPVALLFLPLVFLIEYIVALGIALLSAALTVYFRDLEHILGIVTMAWMYLTPIVYSIDMVPVSLLPIFNANPITPIIAAYRDILYYKKIPQIDTLIHAAFLGFFILCFGGYTFSRLQKNFVEEL